MSVQNSVIMRTAVTGIWRTDVTCQCTCVFVESLLLCCFVAAATACPRMCGYAHDFENYISDSVNLPLTHVNFKNELSWMSVKVT